MSRRRLKAANWLVLVLAAALCWIGWRDTGAKPDPVAGQDAKMAANILRPLLRDERLFQQSRTLAALAQTQSERSLASQAQHVAGELMDASFAIAMARTNGAQPANADAKDAARLRRTQDAVKQDQLWIAKLSSPQAGRQGVMPASAAMPLAQAQLALDQARLQDATNDLARGSGDAATRIQQLQQEYETTHGSVVTSPTGTTTNHGLAGAVQEAWEMRTQTQQLTAAETASRAAAVDILAAHNRARARFTAAEQAQAKLGVRVSQLKALTEQQRQISRLDQEDDAASELADTYHQWAPLAEAQKERALHAVWRDLLELLLIVAAMLGLMRLWERLLAHPRLDRKRALTLMHLLQVVTELSALGAILLVIFGRPPQTLTFLGLCGAGLTLAFQDTIMSLAGWFALMSRHGVRVGDWVEINGVVGEVVEIRLLRTVLLETGNWITAGHPTGRRVFFPNNFALKGCYFNYSTDGQWMWDELALSVPGGADAHAAAQRVQKALETELKPEMERARAEWKESRTGMPADPEPTVHLRPSGSGFDLVARYTTPARLRATTRERLWNVIAATLADTAAATAR